MKHVKREKPVQVYLNQKINYGGEIRTRGSVIAEMQKQCTLQRLIDAYMMGAKGLTGIELLALQRAEREKTEMSTIDDLKAVLLEQDGTVSICGSDKDKEIIGRAFAGIEKQLELFAGEVLRLTREVVRLKGTGLRDADDKEFLEGDPVRLDFETVHMEGVVRKAKSGEWELYADDDNHVGLLHNQGRIRKIN